MPIRLLLNKRGIPVAPSNIMISVVMLWLILVNISVPGPSNAYACNTRNGLLTPPNHSPNTTHTKTTTTNIIESCMTTYKNPALTVDALTVVEKQGKHHILLIKRGNEPYKGMWAFPGGFVDYNEDPETAVLRELKEECHVTGSQPALVTVSGAPGRDPRKHTVTVAYAVRVDDWEPLLAGDDAAHAELVPLEDVMGGREKLAFDHGAIVEKFLSWWRRNRQFFDTEGE
eukprot:gb/GECH01002775.1/.p1 GENE.gb/GECH01002775.1/~~gb/GECH01002775.1/.p1  ORF type:complete len:229 (+),score=26.18 gb/GECH01002775.1/:1-687(+)